MILDLILNQIFFSPGFKIVYAQISFQHCNIEIYAYYYSCTCKYSSLFFNAFINGIKWCSFWQENLEILA